MDSQAAMEMTEMERRAFLRSMGLTAAFLLEAPFPTTKPGLLSSQHLAIAADKLAGLRRLDGQHGAAVVAVEAAELAEYLLRRLKTTPEADGLRRGLALLTGEAASLAGHTAFNLGETAPARAWARVVEECGRQARSPDLAGWGVLQQANMRYWWGDADGALGSLYRAPRDGMSAQVRAKVEATRSFSAAASSHPPMRRDRWARDALDRAHDAITQADADPSELPFVWWVDSSNHREDRGLCYALLGRGEDAYEVLEESIRQAPAELYRGIGIKQLYLARAAVLNGDVDRACAHAGEAHRILTETASAPYVQGFREFRDVDLAPYADSAAVRRLDEQLSEHRATTATATADEASARPRRPPRRYFKVYGRDGTWRLHMADCPDGLRARKRHPFPLGNGRRPERLAAHPELRPGVIPCERCIGPLWT